jgi:hypothetical protein
MFFFPFRDKSVRLYPAFMGIGLVACEFYEQAELILIPDFPTMQEGR